MMHDFTSCVFVIVIAAGLFTALSVAATEYYRSRSAWARFDAMMRDRAAADPQNAARETQG